MAQNTAKCWCGQKLIEGVTVKGEFFPFGFLSCSKHSCWYESKEDYKKHLAGECIQRGARCYPGWGPVNY